MTQPDALHPHDPSWAQRFRAEAEALMRALGHATDGGVIYEIEHVGGTSVAGLAARPCIDIVVQVDNRPLGEERVRAVADLGYAPSEDEGPPGCKLFRKGRDEFHLHVVTFDSGLLPRYLVVRNHLRADPRARDRYQRRKRDQAERFLAPGDGRSPDAYERGRTALVTGLEEEAFAWHVATTGFAPVETIERELDGMPCPWFVSSGWALDLFAGEPSRYHEDLDVALARGDQLHVQKRLCERGWALHEVVDGRYVAWREGEAIAKSTLQVHGRKGGIFLDLIFEPREEGHWVFRRDPEIRMPMAEAGLRARGVPHLAPEIVLLFKSRSSLSPDGGPRDKDQADFERVFPRLGAKRRAWLRAAVARRSPDHPWLRDLRGGAA